MQEASTGGPRRLGARVWPLLHRCLEVILVRRMSRRCDERGFREIYATHLSVEGEGASHPTIRVYQAYNEQIALAAAAANSFAAPRDAGIWSESRMTWVKPSAAWMAYRCGWTLFKDKNQACVLALDVDRSRFEALLMEAVVTDDAPADQKGTFKEKPVVVQWDPEREMDVTLAAGEASGRKAGTEPFLRKLEAVRSLQIGLRGRASALLLDPTFVRRITNVTAQFEAAHAELAAGDAAAAKMALCPDERRMEVPKELREALHMDIDNREAAAHEEAVHDEAGAHDTPEAAPPSIEVAAAAPFSSAGAEREAVAGGAMAEAEREEVHQHLAPRHVAGDEVVHVGSLCGQTS